MKDNGITVLKEEIAEINGSKIKHSIILRDLRVIANRPSPRL
jgi:hypothetical protein